MGVVLLIVGIIGAIASVALFGWGSGGIRRHRTMIDDGSGDIVSREDTYQ